MPVSKQTRKISNYLLDLDTFFASNTHVVPTTIVANDYWLEVFPGTLYSFFTTGEITVYSGKAIEYEGTNMIGFIDFMFDEQQTNYNR